jgi:hypothetical protein
MERFAGYEIQTYLNLGNFVLTWDSKNFTTGDHDGVAALLCLRDPSKPRPRKSELDYPEPTVIVPEETPAPQ